MKRPGSLRGQITHLLAKWSENELSTQDIVDNIPADPKPTGNTVRRILTDLVRDGDVVRTERGWFAITAKGIEETNKAFKPA